MEVSLLAGDESFTIPHRLQTRCVSGYILHYVAADCGCRLVVTAALRRQRALAARGFQARAAIDATTMFLLSSQLFEGEKSFESPAVHLTAGGEFRIRSRVG